MISDVRIRRIVASDLPRIAEIHQTVLSNDLMTKLGKRVLVETVYPALLLSDVNSMAVERNGKIVGFAFLTEKISLLGTLVSTKALRLVGVALRNPLRSIGVFVSYVIETRIDYDCELYWVCIDRDHQQKGFGTKMIRAILHGEESNNRRKVIVRTLSSTPQNVAFYISLGFEFRMSRFGRVWLTRDIRESKSKH